MEVFLMNNKNKVYMVTKTVLVSTAIFAAVTILSCSDNLTENLKTKTTQEIQCNFTAVMPEFKSEGQADTKASLSSVVKINWTKNDRLVVLNLTKGKQLGGYLNADNNGISSSFTPTNLTGTISAGDKLVFLLDYKKEMAVVDEQDYNPISVDFSSQRGDGTDVPIVVYAEYTASQDNNIDATNPDFNFLVSYMQLALSALPATTSVSSVQISDISSGCMFTISNDKKFIATPQNGSITLNNSFNANSKGANTRYFSCFSSEQKATPRDAMIIANGNPHHTAWLKSAFNVGFYYQSVATGFTNENIQFVDDVFKSYCVSHFDGNNDGEVSFAEAAAVTSYPAFTDAEKSSIMSVYELAYFPSELGLPSFAGLTALKNVILPGTLTAIPDNAFNGCTSLEEINIPDNVTTIGTNAFKGCTSLQYFSGNLASSDHQFLIDGEYLLAFAPNKHNNVKIPDNIRYINDGVFENCANMRSVNLSQTTNIGNNTFAGCTSLNSINLVNDIVSIGDEAFKGCSSLETVYSQNSTPAAIGTDVFTDCAPALKIFVAESDKSNYDADVTWSQYTIVARNWHKIYYTTTDGQPITPNAGLDFGYSIEPWYLGYNGDITIMSNTYNDGQGVIEFSGNIRYLPKEWDDVNSFYASMFTNQTTLVSITFPECIEELPSVSGCNNLVSINIPECVDGEANIEDKFSGCTSISTFSGTHTCANGKYVVFNGKIYLAAPDLPAEITIPGEVNSIGGVAFLLCSNLKKVTIMDNIKEIGLQAFHSNPCEIEDYYFTATQPPILSGDESTFWFKSDGKIYVPMDAVDTYKTAGQNWEAYKDRIIGY